MTAVHTDSSLRVRCIGVRAASQSLKSPTSDTVAARGATTTNPNARALAGLEGRSGRHRTTATNTAAIASAPNGDSRMVRGRMSQRHTARTGPAVRRAGKRAICSITRASRPASIATGRRSCRTTRPISSSSGSNTFRLSENRLQLLARPLHSHLERRHARTGQLRHLFVLEVLDVLEKKRFPVFRGQPRQRPAHDILPLGLLGGTGVSYAVQRGFVAHDDVLQVRCHWSWSITRWTPLAASLVVTLCLGGCYQDDTTVNSPQAVQPVITVRLTDAPFPYDSLHSVTIHVVRIEANITQDTSGDGHWVVITQPRKSFDLLALQQATTALLGAGEMPAGQYHAVRMTIDTSQSAITWNDAAQTPAQVNWNGWATIYAFVEYPVSVATESADIVLDFDIGRSFLFNFKGNYKFDFTPQLRAINSAAAGAIAGTVTQGSGATTSPVPNAQVSVFATYPGQPDSIGYLEATGRSDSSGRYHVGFLPPGRYFVKIEEPFMPSLESIVTPNVQVTAGQTSPLSVSLPQAGGGHAYVHISGPTQVGVGGTISLWASVGGNNGHPVYTQPVTWTSSDPSVATVTAPGDKIGRAHV